MAFWVWLKAFYEVICNFVILSGLPLYVGSPYM